jgi:hypothetical protein
MLWYCRLTWYPGVTRQQVADRVGAQHDAGRNHQDRIRGWYTLIGGGAAFRLVETDLPDDRTELLQPYMDVMSWDVYAVQQLDYARQVARLRQVAQGVP